MLKYNKDIVFFDDFKHKLTKKFANALCLEKFLLYKLYNINYVMIKFYLHKILINPSEFVCFTHSSYSIYYHQPHPCKQIRLPVI